MFIENYTTFMNNFGQKNFFKLAIFSLLSIFAGVLEFLGIVFIYPFVFLILSPEKIIHSAYYLKLASILHITDQSLITFVIGLAIVCLFTLKNCFMILVIAWQSKFSISWKNEIKNKFMQYYMFAPYKNSLKTTASQKIYNITTLSTQVVDGFVFRSMTLLTNFIIIFMILSLLFVKFPISAIVTVAFVVITMQIQNKFFKSKTVALAKELASSSAENNVHIMQNIVNLKDLKILSAQNYFYNEYEASQKKLASADLKVNFLNVVPPYIIENFIIIALMILAGLISIQKFTDPSLLIASYAVIIAAFFRMAPALNRIQSSINAINSSRDFVKALNLECSKCDFSDIEVDSNQRAVFDYNIQFRAVNFSYELDKPILKNINLRINKGEFIGVVGASGAGKTTLVDVLMGLLPIDEGEILVDGNVIESFSSLRKIIGYVPQQINILDKTLRENIAWAVAPVDDNLVVRSLKDAQIYEFLKENRIGLNSMLKVNGLSQGQMQRLAIARVLYRNPEILIFDEATSALDMQTEHEITQVLENLKGKRTIISIAHRLSTLKNCDKLIFIKAGEIVDIGTFEELSNRHSDFENLLKLSQIN